MKESFPQQPSRQEGQGEERKRLSRRSFLKRSALAAGMLATGAAGVFSGKKMERASGKPEETAVEAPVKSIQEQVDERYQIYVQAIESGDEDSMRFGLETIKRLSQELENVAKNYAELQKMLIRVPSGGKRALLENELQFNRERQEWLTNEIKSLREPIDAYLEKSKSGDSNRDVNPSAGKREVEA